MTAAEFGRELQLQEKFLFSFALKMTRDYQDAQDLYQDAAARAFKYRDKYQMGTNFRAWMATIIRNTLINRYRKNRRRRVVDDPIENFLFAYENNNSIPNAGEENMRLQELLQHIGGLSERYRIPFLMHYQGYEYKEIAQYLNIPIGTVKSRLNTARSLLKEHLSRTR